MFAGWMFYQTSPPPQSFLGLQLTVFTVQSALNDTAHLLFIQHDKKGQINWTCQNKNVQLTVEVIVQHAEKKQSQNTHWRKGKVVF